MTEMTPVASLEILHIARCGCNESSPAGPKATRSVAVEPALPAHISDAPGFADQEEDKMRNRRFSEEQIIGLLKETEAGPVRHGRATGICGQPGVLTDQRALKPQAGRDIPLARFYA
jgi:hypothetical protein